MLSPWGITYYQTPCADFRCLTKGGCGQMQRAPINPWVCRHTSPPVAAPAGPSQATDSPSQPRTARNLHRYLGCLSTSITRPSIAGWLQPRRRGGPWPLGACPKPKDLCAGVAPKVNRSTSARRALPTGRAQRTPNWEASIPRACAGRYMVCRADKYQLTTGTWAFWPPDVHPNVAPRRPQASPRCPQEA